MRLQIFSDLHADFNRWPAPPDLAEADIVVVAGDVCEGVARGFKYLRAHISAPTPIVMVAGNHEFYRSSLERELASARRAAPALVITFLDDGTAEIDGIRFIGTTLWTDYDFFGTDLRRDAMAAAEDGLMDHRLIRADRGPRLTFRPEDARERHFASRRFLDKTLSRPFAGPTVVVTHHAPHERSVHPAHRESLLTAAFVSDLSDVIAFQPELWVHGHTHARFDYRIGTTRVICNPRGYGGENRAFDPGLVVEV